MNPEHPSSGSVDIRRGFRRARGSPTCVNCGHFRVAHTGEKCPPERKMDVYLWPMAEYDAKNNGCRIGVDALSEDGRKATDTRRLNAVLRAIPGVSVWDKFGAPSKKHGGRRVTHLLWSKDTDPRHVIMSTLLKNGFHPTCIGANEQGTR